MNNSSDKLTELISEIEKLKTRIMDLQEEKKMSKIDSSEDLDIAILDDAINEMERQVEVKTYKQNELRELMDFQSKCSHVFVDDLIDLTPDKSVKVTYCAHCLLSLRESDD
jgi:tryptophanyl-tRNA synthetase